MHMRYDITINYAYIYKYIYGVMLLIITNK